MFMVLFYFLHYRNYLQVHVPSIYSDRLVLCKSYKKPIERLVYRREKGSPESLTPAEKTREIIARRGALEFNDGMYGKWIN